MKRTSTYRIPIHQDGHVTSFSEILRHVNGAEIFWRMTDLQAISIPSPNLNILDLESQVHDSPEGLIFTHEALVELSQALDQVIDCEILGFTRDPQTSSPGKVVIIIRALDSTEWEVVVDKSRNLLRGSFN